MIERRKGSPLWAHGLLILWHALPIAPFVLGYPYLGLAALLLVALPYIKVKKFDAQVLYLAVQTPTDLPPDDARARLQTLRRRWLAMTFLSAHED